MSPPKRKSPSKRRQNIRRLMVHLQKKLNNIGSKPVTAVNTPSETYQSTTGSQSILQTAKDTASNKDTCSYPCLFVCLFPKSSEKVELSLHFR